MSAAEREWACDWQPDDLNPGPECPYCAGQMCARFDGLTCTHDSYERHGYARTGPEVYTTAEDQPASPTIDPPYGGSK